MTHADALIICFAALTAVVLRQKTIKFCHKRPVNLWSVLIESTWSIKCLIPSIKWGADTVITYVSASIQQADLFNLKPLAQLFDFFQTGLGVFPMHIVQRGNQGIH